MKKTLTLFLCAEIVTLATLCIVTGIFVIQNVNTPHVHEFSQWEQTRQSTCVENGQRMRQCACGEVQVESLPRLKHLDQDKDHRCDACHMRLGTHMAAQGKHTCDYCGLQMSQCADNDFDHACDVCDATVGIHEAAEGTHICDYCGARVTDCIDNNKDHICDICEDHVGIHVAASGKHECAYCGEIVSVCQDEDKDHHCEVCSAWMGTHEAAPGKHTCDYCLQVISLCVDADKDHQCDICRAILSTCSEDEGVVSQLPSCIDDGVRSYTCTYCAKLLRQESIPALGHKMTEKVDPDFLCSAATCKSPASYYQSCTFCEVMDEQTFFHGEPDPDNHANLAFSYINNGDGTHKKIHSCCDVVANEQQRHEYANGQCPCGERFSIGLSYSAKGDDYIVTGIGTCADSDLIIPDYYQGKPVLEIADFAFAAQLQIKSVKIPDTVTSVGVQAFANCSNIENISLGNGVTTIGSSAFFACTSVTSVTIPEKVGSISDWAFKNCVSLENIVIEAGEVSIGQWAFHNTAFYLNTENWENEVLYIGVHLIEAKKTLSGTYQIKEGTLTIARWAFEGCTGLMGISIPDNVIVIEDYAFHNCGLTSIEIGTGVKIIGRGAFQACNNLVSVHFSGSLQTISHWAFGECTNLAQIDFQGTAEQWTKVCKKMGWDDNTGEYVIRCTDGQLSKLNDEA